MTIEEMKEKKIELGYTYAQIAALANLPVSTVQKIFCGVTKAPRYETIRALEEVMGSKRRYDLSEKSSLKLGEGSPAYNHVNKDTDIVISGKRPGEYNLDDYYSLPDEERFELIDGVFYEMASPPSVHQLISGCIFDTFFRFIMQNKGPCVAASAPLDVQLDKDDKTLLQPDVMIVCDRNKIQRKVVYGAPDLVVEILSASTKRKDMVLKLNKYCNAGVREYWIVDPDEKLITVYKFGENMEYKIYDRNATVPVGIYNGECQVNFAEIFDYVSFLDNNN